MTAPAHVFAALADPARCRIVELLHDQPMPVHRISAAFAISRPAVSRHLRVLKEAGLVQEQKRGRENVYVLERANLAALNRWLARFWASRLDALKLLSEDTYGGGTS
jgi:DNA-binding transcriptional ArsR family regulator